MDCVSANMGRVTVETDDVVDAAGAIETAEAANAAGAAMHSVRSAVKNAATTNPPCRSFRAGQPVAESARHPMSLGRACSRMRSDLNARVVYMRKRRFIEYVSGGP